MKTKSCWKLPTENYGSSMLNDLMGRLKSTNSANHAWRATDRQQYYLTIFNKLQHNRYVVECGSTVLFETINFSFLSFVLLEYCAGKSSLYFMTKIDNIRVLNLVQHSGMNVNSIKLYYYNLIWYKSSRCTHIIMLHEIQKPLNQ